VLEGKIGKIIVKGTKRYRPSVISAAAEKLRGKPLQKSDVTTALLYAGDLPGVTVASTFQPGEHTGDTDLVMIATEAKRPVKFMLGANNYGTDLTGRYRAQAGVEWANPLGIGDVFNLNVDYALDPSDNIYGAATYRAPASTVPGLTAIVGVSRNELQINTGTFAALDVKGPSSLYYGGMDWKFINRDDLQEVSTLHIIREESRLDSLGFHLSDEKFLLAEMTYGLLHTDRRFNGVDILQFGLRKSIRDDSLEPDLVSPLHSRSFLVGKVSYTRLQFLTKSQRLYLKFVGQYTNDALVPLEQLAIGGPDSVRAYPIADALTDRGYYTSLEYHVDAPGFGDKVSPFYGRPWRELLEFQLFVDYAKGFSVGANRDTSPDSVTLSGAGAGLIFRLPRFHHFEFHLNGAVPLGSRDASDKKGYHIYSRFSFTF
jgi:hemolysin activation/secretion protein